MTVSEKTALQTSLNIRQAGHDDTGQADIDSFLQMNMLETLADFDFSGVDLNGTEADGHAANASASTGRKRPHSQAWDNVTSKALTGVGELYTESYADGSPCPVGMGVTGVVPESVRAAVNTEEGRNFVSPAADSLQVPATRDEHSVKACKARRTTGAKRVLNPDRMERKANREKRRREEVNEKFEHLLRVLEEAEGMSDIGPNLGENGVTASNNTCVNGRRVEVLSRTIRVLKILLSERHMSRRIAQQEAEEKVTPKVVVEPEGTNTTVSSCPSAAPKTTSAARTTQAAGPSAQPSPLASVGNATVPVPSGFSVPAGMSTGMPHLGPGMSTGQPFFIAVPMFMPGQGSCPNGNGNADSVPAPAATSTSSPTPSTSLEESASLPVCAGPSHEKEGWPMPGVAFPPMMTLQMPQFVTRALAQEEGDEKPTHAMCA